MLVQALDESGPLGLLALSVAHYGEQNGDLMRAPEMCFELGLTGGQNARAARVRRLVDVIAVDDIPTPSLDAEIIV